jgi:hypothetical protein
MLSMIETHCCVWRFCLLAIFDGIVLHFSNQFGWHVIAREIVLITLTILANAQSCALRPVVDFQVEGLFESLNETNSLICDHLKDLRINLTHYLIQSHCNYSRVHLNSLILERPNDGLK